VVERATLSLSGQMAEICKISGIAIPVRTFHKLPLVVRESDLAILATWPSILHSKFVWEVLPAD
jgi:hypothetical protein